MSNPCSNVMVIFWAWLFKAVFLPKWKSIPPWANMSCWIDFGGVRTVATTLLLNRIDPSVRTSTSPWYRLATPWSHCSNCSLLTSLLGLYSVIVGADSQRQQLTALVIQFFPHYQLGNAALLLACLSIKNLCMSKVSAAPTPQLSDSIIGVIHCNFTCAGEGVIHCSDGMGEIQLPPLMLVPIVPIISTTLPCCSP